MPDDEYPDGSVPYTPHQGIIRLPFEAIILTLAVIILKLSPGFSLILVTLAICFLYPSYLSFREKQFLNSTICLGEGHPFREDESDGKADVYVKDLSGLWKKLGDKRFRIHKDEMIDVVNMLEDGGNYEIEMGLFESKSIKEVHKKCLSFINASLAYRDAYLGENDTIEDARKREDDDTLSLDREWPEEEELLEPGIKSFKSKDE